MTDPPSNESNQPASRENNFRFERKPTSELVSWAFLQRLISTEMGEVLHSSLVIDSFSAIKVLHAGIGDLKKKRKHLDGQVDFPPRKHRYHDRFCGSEDEHEFLEVEENEETTDGKSYSHLESFKDSNSFAGEYDTSMSTDADDICTFEKEFVKPFYHDQPSTSSGTSSDAVINNLYSLASRLTKRKQREQIKDLSGTNVEDGAELETVYQSTQTKLSRVEMNNEAFTCSEYGIDDKAKFSDLAPEEMLLYSNDITSNLYILPTENWSTKQETLLKARKPTIDQEFEEYFSSLML